MRNYKQEVVNGVLVEIPDMPNYFCSRAGEIISMKTSPPKPVKIAGKYTQIVRPCVNGTLIPSHVHDLVAKTFLDNPNDYKYVRHLNADSYDNRVENLEWCSEPVKYSSPQLFEKRMATLEDRDQWKSLHFYPGYYFHKDGRVLSAGVAKLKILKPTYRPKPSVLITNSNGDRKLVQIAKLIAQCYLPNEGNYREVVNIDGNINNVAVSNLAWDEESGGLVRDFVHELEDSEMWKNIRTCPGYKISRLGEIVSIKTSTYKLIKPEDTVKQTSYRLKINGITIVYPVQKLLGLTFLNNPYNYDYVAPINGDLMDIRLENLMWWPNPNGVPEEPWIPMKNWTQYEIAPFGIRNVESKMMLKPYHPKGNGYPSVTIYDGKGNSKVQGLHILIAKNFLPNPNDLPIVNHIDGDHDNYVLDNLEWCSYSENLQHAYDTGLRNGSASVQRNPIPGEVWKQLNTGDAAYDDKYMVSDHGNVKIVASNKILKLRKCLDYHIITLTCEGNKIYPSVHRLVAFTFLNVDNLGKPLTPDINYEVNHKNKIRCDNRIQNLEIMRITDHRSKDQGIPLFLLKIENGKTLYHTFKSMSEAAQEMGWSISAVTKTIKSGKPREGWYYFSQEDPMLEEKVDNILDANKDT